MLKKLIEESYKEFFIQDTENYHNRYASLATSIRDGVKTNTKNDLERVIHKEIKEIIYEMLDLTFSKKYVVANEFNKIAVNSIENVELFALYFDEEHKPLRYSLKVDNFEKKFYTFTKEDYVSAFHLSKKTDGEVKTLIEAIMIDLDEFCMTIVDIVKLK